MRSMLRTVPVALVAVLALGAVAASSALASPEFYVKKAGVFKKVTESVNVTLENQFELIDTKNEGFGESCTGEASGAVKAAGLGNLETFRVFERCKGLGNPLLCETAETGTALNMPWGLELYKEGTEVRNRIVEGVSKNGTPAWHFSCKGRFGEGNDTCNVNTSAHITNNATKGWVEVVFDAKSKKTKCSGGGAESGEWKGVLKMKPTEKEKKAGVEAIKVE
jgi:hypothetical protein